jgi:hypothetical protein
MASPWNFLARLTRRRRDRDEKEESATGDVTPEEVKSAEPILDEAGNTPEPRDRPAEAKPQPAETVEAAIITPESAEAGNNVHAKAGRKRAVPAGPTGDAPVVPASTEKVGKKNGTRHIPPSRPSKPFRSVRKACLVFPMRCKVSRRRSGCFAISWRASFSSKMHNYGQCSRGSSAERVQTTVPPRSLESDIVSGTLLWL